jgi:hypothetical protein
MYGFSRDAQLQTTVNTGCWHKTFVLCQNFVFWIGAECYCQVAELIKNY